VKVGAAGFYQDIEKWINLGHMYAAV